MRALRALAILMFAAASAAAHAQCACTGQAKLNASRIATAVGNKTVCVGSAPNWQHQEFHSGLNGGPVIDYKRGPSDKVDPSETVGSWGIESNGGGNNALLAYVYTGGGSYKYAVCTADNITYGLCPNGSAGLATISFTTRPTNTGC